MCLQHRIRCCTHVQPEKTLQKRKGGDDPNDGGPVDVTDYRWRAPTNLTCWEKAHRFYIPMGLFRDNVAPITEEELNEGGKCFQHCVQTLDVWRQKREALGLPQMRKKQKRDKTGKAVEETQREPNDDGRDDDSDESFHTPGKVSEELGEQTDV